MPHKQTKSDLKMPDRVERLGFRLDPETTLVLSDRDRKAFFDALVHPPEPSERLARVLAEHQRRVAS